MLIGSEILISLSLAIALSIDSFAVAAGTIKTSQIGIKREIYFSRTALLFATVQFILFLLGYLLGQSSLRFFAQIDHWVAASILLFLAYNVWLGRHEAIWSSNATEKRDFGQTLGTTFLSALATSLDAFGAGTGSAFSHSNLMQQGFIIFLITGGAVWAALHMGQKIPHQLQQKLPHFSVAILILLAVKIVIFHN